MNKNQEQIIRAEHKRLSKKKTVATLLNLVRQWQCDGMPVMGDAYPADSDEAFRFVAHLQKRLRALSRSYDP